MQDIDHNDKEVYDTWELFWSIAVWFENHARTFIWLSDTLEQCTFYLIQSSLVLQSLITKLFGDKNLLNIRRDLADKLNSIELNRNDWQLLVDIFMVLKPFELATKLMSGRRYPTVGLCFYSIRKLKHFLDNNEDDSTQVKWLKHMFVWKTTLLLFFR